MNLIIYHGGCTDGVAAAYAAWKAGYDDGCLYHEGVHGTSPPWGLIDDSAASDELYILDFSYPLDVMLEISDRFKGRCIILDHHASAQRELNPLIFEQGWEGEFDMYRCGSMMAWNWFHPNLESPWMFEHIDARDRWLAIEERPPYNDAVTFFIRTHPHNLGPDMPISRLMYEWDKMMNSTEENVFLAGEYVHKYFRQLVEIAKTWKALWNIGKYSMPVVNAPYFLASEVAGELAEDSPCGAAAVYWVDAENEEVTFSLRSRGDGIDVGEFATHWGGGGHRGAAGFRIPIKDFRPAIRQVWKPD